MRCLKAFAERIAARDPARQTAEIHIRVTLINRFNALATAEVLRVASHERGKGKSHLTHDQRNTATGRSCGGRACRSRRSGAGSSGSLVKACRDSSGTRRGTRGCCPCPGKFSRKWLQRQCGKRHPMPRSGAARLWPGQWAYRPRARGKYGRMQGCRCTTGWPWFHDQGLHPGFPGVSASSTRRLQVPGKPWRRSAPENRCHSGQPPFRRQRDHR